VCTVHIAKTWLCAHCIQSAPLWGNAVFTICGGKVHLSVTPEETGQKRHVLCAASHRSVSHVTHTPARRLFRSIISSPQHQAQQYVTAAVRELYQVAVAEWMEDVTRAFFWWTNVQHLRVLLQHLQDGDVQVPGDWSWLRDEMDPQLLVLCQRSSTFSNALF
jgi:hypothetical protein